MTGIFAKDKHFKWHHGRLGGYLEDENTCLYGITCKHVTQASHDGFIYVKNKNREFIKFGKTMGKFKDYKIAKDIDLIVINEDVFLHCDKTLRNSKGTICIASIYEGGMEMIFCQKVFMWVSSSTDTMVNDELPSHIVYGIIASAEIHRVFNEELDTNGSFVVESDLFKPGDSGNLLLMEDDGKLYILGIVLGGKVPIAEKEYILCLRFDHGKRILEEMMGKKMMLPKICTEVTTTDRQPSKGAIIQAGTCIWVKVPEDVAVTDFVLFEHLIMLIECFGFNEFSANAVKRENYFEEQLNKYVDSRNENLYSIAYETTDQKCFLECMKGCENIYSGKPEQSDMHFKDAVRVICKTSCRNRLLCKLITYSTWLLLDMEKLDNMGELLKDGEEYLLKMKECDACPLKSIGFFYYDYSRYYNSLHNYKDAMRMARKSLEYFECDEKFGGGLTHEKSFALCMIADLNLLCGENFETRHLPVVDIKEAEQCVDDMKRFSKELPVVEKAPYLLVKSDLHYRRGEIKKALESAKKCYFLAMKNNLNQERNEALIRIRELSSSHVDV